MTTDQEIRARAAEVASVIVAALVKKSNSEDYDLYNEAKEMLSNLTVDIQYYIESDIKI